MDGKTRTGYWNEAFFCTFFSLALFLPGITDGDKSRQLPLQGFHRNMFIKEFFKRGSSGFEIQFRERKKISRAGLTTAELQGWGSTQAQQGLSEADSIARPHRLCLEAATSLLTARKKSNGGVCRLTSNKVNGGGLPGGAIK